ncbi:hypothetical protein [Bradyrhizobium guangdongense]
MNDSQRLLDFDPDFCRRIAKWGAVVCLVWLALAICILALVHPSSRCPAWTIHDKKGGATSLWVVVGYFTGFPTAWLCFIVLRWKGFVRTICGSGEDRYKRFLASKGWDYESKPAAYVFPVNALFGFVIAMWSLLCSMPLWVMVLPCL